jgi:hypothetical protein
VLESLGDASVELESTANGIAQSLDATRRLERGPQPGAVAILDRIARTILAGRSFGEEASAGNVERSVLCLGSRGRAPEQAEQQDQAKDRARSWSR